MDDRLHKLQNAFTFILIAGSVAFTFVCIAGPWPNWWVWIIFEQTPMTWFETVLLCCTSLFIFLSGCIDYVHLRIRHAKLWFITSAAFLYLALDDRFAIHERIRDRILAPQHVRFPFFPWTDYGDFLLLLILIAGLFWLPKFWKLLHGREARLWFAIGVVFAALSVLFDSIPMSSYSLHTQRLQQFYEELGEAAAIVCFLLASFHSYTTQWIKFD